MEAQGPLVMRVIGRNSLRLEFTAEVFPGLVALPYHCHVTEVWRREENVTMNLACNERYRDRDRDRDRDVSLAGEEGGSQSWYPRL